MDHVEEYNKDPNPYNAVTMFCKGDLCQSVKLFCSFIVVTILIIVVFTGISLGYCVLKVHPAVGFLIMFFCLTLLAYIEALHYVCVACEKWDMKVIGKNFPRALRCHALVDTRSSSRSFWWGASSSSSSSFSSSRSSRPSRTCPRTLPACPRP